MLSLTRRALAASLGACAVAARPAAGRPLVVATAQMASAPGEIAGNLTRATALAEAAAAKGARLVLFPEFMPGGYVLDETAWRAAEPRDGPTARWLAATARRLDLWIGTTFLEADGDDFFNTFVLSGPDGREAGRVRKGTPAGLEAYVFKAGDGPRVIETALGRIGVGICFESFLCSTVARFAAGRPDLILLPHSYPDLAASGGLASPPGSYVAGWYARRFGVPVLMVNKVGAWASPTPFGPAAGTFPGRSAIVDAGGAVLSDMAAAAGVATARVRMGLPRPAPPACPGELIAELAPSPSAGPALLAAAGARAYGASPRRAAAARAVTASGSPAGSTSRWRRCLRSGGCGPGPG